MSVTRGKSAVRVLVGFISCGAIFVEGVGGAATFASSVLSEAEIVGVMSTALIGTALMGAEVFWIVEMFSGT